MSKKIIYEKMSGVEKLYRIMIIATYIFAAAVIVSCVFTVPNIDIDTSPLMAAYSIAFFVYTALIIACAVVGVIFFKKTGKEVGAFQAMLLGVAALFNGFNFKMFFIIFLYGIGKESKVEELFGSDVNTITESFQSGWTLLVIAFSIMMVLAILSIAKMASKKHS